MRSEKCQPISGDRGKILPTSVVVPFLKLAYPNKTFYARTYYRPLRCEARPSGACGSMRWSSASRQMLFSNCVERSSAPQL